MKQRKKTIVKGRFNGLRLDLYIGDVFFGETDPPTRKDIQALITDGLVLVDEKRVRPSHRLKPGEEVALLSPEKNPKGDKTEDTAITTPVLFENADFLVINKPAGLVMHPVRRGQTGTLTDWILQKYPELTGVGEDERRPGIVHRLDQETSGVLLLAKTKRSFMALKKLFQERQVAKTYRALVYGHMPEKNGSVETPVGRIRGGKERGVPLEKRVFSGALRSAETQYTLITRYPQYDLLSLEPKTGRTHQIRVHLASLGHPVVGDRLYAFKIHKKDTLQPKFHLLHAERLSFIYKRKRYDFVAPLPDYFENILQQIR